MKNTKKKFPYWIIPLVIFSIWILWPISPIEEETKPLLNISPLLMEVKDNFSGIDFSHWGHMPLSYSFKNTCYEWEYNLTRLAFEKIKEETSGVVWFEEDNLNPDISIFCKPGDYGGRESYTIADALITEEDFSRNLIEKGELNFYGQGNKCSTGYPALEVHEILHLFGIPHNPLVDSIMHPYSASYSMKCKTTEIDKEYISCLKYVYSNGSFEGNCNFPNFITEEPEYEYGCNDGWYPVEREDFCCPEPGMIIIENYCEYP